MSDKLPAGMAETGEKRVALVTGGAKRVGRAIVEKLASEGFEVVFTYNSSEVEANELARKVRGRAVRADLTDPAAAVAAIRDAVRGGRLDVLVNNASSTSPPASPTPRRRPCGASWRSTSNRRCSWLRRSPLRYARRAGTS
jgi:NAD(P)-dependent dehydrogenase (short-subunit alcohol dehydrogenase family)